MWNGRRGLLLISLFMVKLKNQIQTFISSGRGIHLVLSSTGMCRFIASIVINTIAARTKQ